MNTSSLPFRGARILLIGSSNTDLVLTCNRLPKPGETLLGGEFEKHHGGKGANQAVAAARAGAHVAFVGARGADDFGRTAAAALRKEGINIRHFAVHPGANSGIAMIMVGGRQRENIIAVARSANDRVTPAAIRALEKEFSRANVIVTQLETPLPAVGEIARQAVRAGKPLVLNPAPAQKLPAALLRRVHVLTPNEHEATLLTGERDLRCAGQKLLRQGCRNIVITLGSRGAMLINADGVKTFRAPKVRAVDTVGAGDCFSGWLAAGLGAGEGLETILPLALRAASLSVTRRGAQPSLPEWRELVE